MRKLKLNVRKMKCTEECTKSDVVVLVELTDDTPTHLQCPICLGDLESIGEITVIEEIQEKVPECDTWVCTCHV